MSYTPTSINDIVYNSVTERQLIMDIGSGDMQFPFCGKNGILLYGIYGTGKTTLAKLLPEAIERGKGGISVIVDYYACKRGIIGLGIMSTIDRRSDVMSFNHSGFHYYILDEVDLLTDAALETLKSVMNKDKTIFIMTTNNISNIDAGVLNRSHRVNCNAAPPHEWLPFARRVLHDNGGRQDDDSKLLPIIASCDGSVREIVCNMQKLASVQRARAVSVQLSLAA